MRRRRWRTAVLWGGCTLCLLITVLFVASAWWLLAAQAGNLVVAVRRGAFVVQFWEPPVSLSVQQHPRLLDRWSTWKLGLWWVEAPLYALFAAVALSTLLVWRFVPKFPRGHCRRCGYNLTGLTEARCPECGQPFERVTRAASPARPGKIPTNPLISPRRPGKPPSETVKPPNGPEMAPSHAGGSSSCTETSPDCPGKPPDKPGKPTNAAGSRKKA